MMLRLFLTRQTLQVHTAFETVYYVLFAVTMEIFQNHVRGKVTICNEQQIILSIL